MYLRLGIAGVNCGEPGREAEGLLLRSLSRTVCQVGGPNGIRTRVPIPPHAFATKSTSCGVLSQRGSPGDGNPVGDRARFEADLVARSRVGLVVILRDIRELMRSCVRTVSSDQGSRALLPGPPHSAEGG